ncbi:glycerophosphodiester phosphodiesterase [Vulgatibacter sp.]|uniref:glycerophosphodiester phosphodiesterase n=1 Tax=Vulgatibacter sp. TaxID=1971226 RepID=UPI00356817B8
MPDHPFFRGLRPTLHIAHRGGALLAPENTLVAFGAAVERYRTAVLETDVQVSADGALVVFHDDTVDRCTDGAGRVDALDLAVLQRLDAGYRFTPDGGATFPFRGAGVRIPTLREALRAFPSLRFNIDFKPASADAAGAFVDLLREEGAVERVCIGSEHDEVGKALVRLLPEGCHFYPRDALTAVVMALKLGAPPPADDPWLVLDMPLTYQGMRLVDADFVRAATAYGRWVNVWTIDDEAEMRQLVQDGVGGVMTDRPDLLRRVLDERPA